MYEIIAIPSSVVYNQKQIHPKTDCFKINIDYDLMESYDHWMPQGIELHQSVLVSQQDTAFSLAIATSAGLAVAPLQADGNLAPLDNWAWSLSEELFAPAKHVDEYR